MNILILANWYPNKNNPINGIFIKDQVRALMEAGLKPIVFFPYDNSIKRGKLLFNIEEAYLLIDVIQIICKVSKNLK